MTVIVTTTEEIAEWRGAALALVAWAVRTLAMDPDFWEGLARYLEREIESRRIARRR